MGAMLGHGGVVVADDSLDMAQMARFALQFCAEESCGKCTLPDQLHPWGGGEDDRLIASTDTAGRQEQVLCYRPLRHPAIRLALRPWRDGVLPV